MTKDEIVKAFDTPSQLELNRLRLENDILQRHITTNQRRIAQLIPMVDKDGHKVADKLDKQYPDWRKVLSSAYLEIKKKTPL